MSKYVLLVGLLAVVGYRWLPPLRQKNVLVLVETKGMYSDKLHQVKGLKAAFRIIENMDGHMAEAGKKEETEAKVNSSSIKKYVSIIDCLAVPVTCYNI